MKATALKYTFSALVWLLLIGTTAVGQDYRVLHHFAGGNQDGAWPLTSGLIQSGLMLYGMTPEGGSNNVGTVFRINTDGTGFQVLHSFEGADRDGSRPFGSLLLSESTLYGMAGCSDTAYRGTIFAMNTDGSGFGVLHRFGLGEGKWPYGTLMQSGSTLYGLTAYGGSPDGDGWVGNGTLFRMQTNGAGFQVLHTFAGGNDDGSEPHGSLIESDTKLYGTTPGGGTGGGTLFRCNLDGSGFELLRRFSGSLGVAPTAVTLLRSDSTLYGMAREGGGSNSGTVFCVRTNGSGFKVLHTFTGGTNDGAWPVSGTLVQSGSVLYGMTRLGGINQTNGTIFAMNTNGSAYRLLHQFDAANGREPWGSLLLSGSTLYGMTSAGGSQNLGVIFALDLRPRLNAARADTNVIVSWSTNFPGFTLESTGQLTGTWTPVPGVTGHSATVPVNVETRQLFRLSKAISMTYLGNEGFLLCGGGKTVMIDGINEVFPDNGVSQGHVDALLVTHYHGDHFDATNSVRYLLNHPATALIGPAQVNDLLRAVDGYEQISNRVTVATPAFGSSVEVLAAGLQFKVVRLRHGDDPAGTDQNVGFLFSIGGLKVLHVGDWYTPNLREFQTLRLAEELIDVAFLNGYLLAYDPQTAWRHMDYLKPKAIVLMHYQINEIQRYRGVVNTMTGLPPVYIMDTPMRSFCLSADGAIGIP